MDIRANDGKLARETASGPKDLLRRFLRRIMIRGRGHQTFGVLCRCGYVQFRSFLSRGSATSSVKGAHDPVQRLELSIIVHGHLQETNARVETKRGKEAFKASDHRTNKHDAIPGDAPDDSENLQRATRGLWHLHGREYRRRIGKSKPWR